MAALPFDSPYPVIPLARACPFAVLSGTPVLSNTGNTVITGGDIGIFPEASITGFPPGIVTPPNTQHAADVVAANAQLDLTAALVAANLLGPGTVLVGDLGGQTLSPGVYSQGTLALTGTLTLDGGGDPNAEFVIISAATLVTAAGPGAAIVSLTNGTQPKNVYWIVNSSATLGTFTDFSGNILAVTSIASQTSASLNGKALARDGAVTLDTNNITSAPCAGAGSCPIITLSSLRRAYLNRSYNRTVVASGGAAPYTYFVSSGSLPTGLILDSATGAITGTPTVRGTYNFTITAIDANGCSGSRAYSMIIRRRTSIPFTSYNRCPCGG